MRAVDLIWGIILTAGSTPDGRHDFLGGDFLLLANSGREVFFESAVASFDGDVGPVEAEDEAGDEGGEVADGVDSLFEALSAALLYPSLR